MQAGLPVRWLIRESKAYITCTGLASSSTADAILNLIQIFPVRHWYGWVWRPISACVSAESANTSPSRSPCLRAGLQRSWPPTWDDSSMSRETSCGSACGEVRLRYMTWLDYLGASVPYLEWGTSHLYVRLPCPCYQQGNAYLRMCA